MNGHQVLQHAGQNVVLVDLAHATPDGTIAVLQDAQRYISLQPPKSVRLLTDVTDAPFNKASATAMREFADRNTPHVAFSAVVGADGLRYVILQTIILLTGRQIRACKDRTEALEWLTTQP